jgi:hypothetical protein
MLRAYKSLIAVLVAGVSFGQTLTNPPNLAEGSNSIH